MSGSSIRSCRRTFVKASMAGLGFGVPLLSARGKAPAGEQRVSRVSISSGHLFAEVVDNHDGRSGHVQEHARNQLPMPSERDEKKHYSKQLYCTVGRKNRFNGYNGISQLKVNDSPSPFLVCASGLNCEMVFDAKEATPEPRWQEGKEYAASPSSVRELAEDKAQITIHPGTRWGVRVEMIHRLVPPYFLDTIYRVTPTVSKVLGPWLGIFWASYMQTPFAPVYYFLGRRPAEATARWYNSLSGFPDSVAFAPADRKIRYQMPRKPSGLLYGVQPIGYEYPVYGGKLDEMYCALMFRPQPATEVRFAYNPSGGGPGVPAWDFQLLIDQPQVDQSYELCSRLVYKPFDRMDEMIDMYRQWKNQV